MSEKFYLVAEEELIDLIANYYEMMMLEYDGVGNWEWYGESRKSIIKERLPDTTEKDLKDMDFYDCARADLENYVLAKES